MLPFVFDAVPLWTGLNSMGSGFGEAKRWYLLGQGGRNTLFVNVTVNELLWGYEDALPCLKLDLPDRCKNNGSAWMHQWMEGDGEDDSLWEGTGLEAEGQLEEEEEDPQSPYFGLSKPLTGFDENCRCQWGLLRDRNISLRDPISMLTGEGGMASRGLITAYNGRPRLGFWKEGSGCDVVEGRQDGFTMPALIRRRDQLDLFVPILQRGMPLVYEKDVDYSGVTALRFIPPRNVLGAPDDPDPERRNEGNECYCLEELNYRCFKSGVLNLGPSQRLVDSELRPPVALSLPHFYNADPSFAEAVEGLDPNKERHEFFLDVVPRLGLPFAAQPRYQLNVVVGSSADPGWPAIAAMRKEIVLPLLWGQEGYPGPTPEMLTLTKVYINY